MSIKESLHKRILRKLKEAGFRFDTNIGVGGIELDFLVYAPDGRTFAVDLKPWVKFDGFTTRAAKQSAHYRQDIGVDRAFLVMEGLDRSYPSSSVVTPERLIPALKEAMTGKGAQTRKPATGILHRPQKEIFAAMPFDSAYDDVYFVAMADAARQVGAVCRRVDQEEYSGEVVDRIRATIRTSDAVIADLSESKPNVLYEVGYAHALGKPTVHICSTPLDRLPFDVSHWNTIEYQKGQTHRLGSRIARRLQAVLKPAS